MTLNTMAATTTAAPSGRAADDNFCISRADAPFGDDGFRDWLSKRDFGLAEATGGAYSGQVTRVRKMGRSTGKHWHPMTFQMMYVLKGWVKMWYEDEGEFVLKQGDFVYHPPRRAHDFMDYSEDLELLEIFAPANPGTVDLPVAA